MMSNTLSILIFMSFLSSSSSLSFCLRKRLQRRCIAKLQFNQIRLKSTSDENDASQRTSVTGMIYGENAEDNPTIQLFTKEGCTLCDKAKDVLQSVREAQPHSLEAVDITDPDKQNFFDMYKWDIPVLHINGLYWTKHRLTSDEAVEALTKAREGNFEVQIGQPNAAEMERKMAERKANS